MTTRTWRSICGWTFACLFCGCLFVAAGGCKIWHSILSKLGLLLTLFVILGIVDRAWGGTWTFTIPASSIDDTYLNGLSSARNTNYEGLLYLVVGESYGDRIGLLGAIDISDSNTAKGGTLDSFKLVIKVLGKDDDFASGDSLKVTWNAIKRTPVTAEATDSSYSYGNHWQAHGATGENDEYTTRETDGVHVDSLLVTYAVAAGDSLTLWGNPDHATSEWWVVRGEEMVGSNGTRIYIRSTESTTASLRPYFVFYGTEGAATPVVRTANKMVGVKK